MSAKTAFQIRQNAEELQQFLRELDEWKDDVKRKEQDPSNRLATGQNLPPVRRQGDASAEKEVLHGFAPAGMVGASTSTRDQASGAERIRSDDYKAWDKFNVDVEAEKVEADESRSLLSRVQEVNNGAEQALVEKEKGNAWFKKGDFKRAIACYTKSMQLDPQNAVLHVNRAMAYLKLQRWADAEADCTTGIALDSKSVKAFWRRGIARRELNKLTEAKKDLEHATVLEPSNRSIKDELQKLHVMIKEQGPTAEKSDVKQPTTGSLQPTRRRLVIEEVGDDSIEEPVPIRTSKIAPTSTKSPALPSPAPPPTAEEQAQPTTSQYATEGVARSTTTEATRTSKPTKTKLPVVPTTLYEFERDWKSIRDNNEALYAYFKAIDPTAYRRIFKNSLESDYLSKILHVVEEWYLRCERPETVISVLENLATLPRFNMTLMFMSKTDKQVVRNIFTWLERHLDIERWSKLQDAYRA
ncbi:RNA polymerase II-associated protein 3 [Gaertneriomyces sp. JEL0708]|nr:RNA polymerase II-associated protein 3 [Gaertneriomyces sp. JEL0708]